MLVSELTTDHGRSVETAPAKNEKLAPVLIRILARRSARSLLTRKLKKGGGDTHTYTYAHTDRHVHADGRKKGQTGGAGIHPGVSPRSPLTEIRSQFRRLQTSSGVRRSVKCRVLERRRYLRARAYTHTRNHVYVRRRHASKWWISVCFST